MNIRTVERKDPNSPMRVLFLLPSEGEATAEDFAMLQAMYSRDPQPIDSAIKAARAEKAGEFMKKFYVGYGHASVAELGQVVIAIENVPMPVAKLIQHYPLYRGQECSTRYIDFSEQHFYAQSDAGAEYQKELREFYMEALGPTTYHMAERFDLDMNDTVDARAAKAAAFDVLRGFLPIGAATSLSWCVDLRNLNERIPILLDYATRYPELFFVCDALLSLMKEVFPNSQRTERQVVGHDLLLGPVQKDHFPGVVHFNRLMRVNGAERGTLEWSGHMDFASWRDLARHRSVYQTFPAIDFGPTEPWYQQNLPFAFAEAGMAILNRRITAQRDSYAQPMATKVPFYLSGDLDKFRYITKLRSGLAVHPTLRAAIFSLADRAEISLPVHETRDWVVTSKRGRQTIEVKK
jgi:thymidylate synthase ThyX